ncbi:hypothetical protein [Sphingobacterium sp. LRF_L2]|uniref:hypothetical protein n=1 Tax=Sphingobacterium sp. LRF_L2 TaxID=3369421 RepID=UPI003F5DB51B
MKVLRYVFLILGLTGLLFASSLQYTHDTSHSHDTSSHQHEHPTKETCALCWFISSQLMQELRLEPLLPEILTISVYADNQFPLSTVYKSNFLSQKSNKDPPSIY